jgi:hypothetical protein
MQTLQNWAVNLRYPQVITNSTIYMDQTRNSFTATMSPLERNKTFLSTAEIYLEGMAQ